MTLSTTTATSISRRRFLISTAAAGGGLALGFYASGLPSALAEKTVLVPVVGVRVAPGALTLQLNVPSVTVSPPWVFNCAERFTVAPASVVTAFEVSGVMMFRSQDTGSE